MYIRYGVYVLRSSQLQLPSLGTKREPLYSTHPTAKITRKTTEHQNLCFIPPFCQFVCSHCSHQPNISSQKLDHHGTCSTTGETPPRTSQQVSRRHIRRHRINALGSARETPLPPFPLLRIQILHKKQTIRILQILRSTRH